MSPAVARTVARRGSMGAQRIPPPQPITDTLWWCTQTAYARSVSKIPPPLMNPRSLNVIDTFVRSLARSLRDRRRVNCARCVRVPAPRARLGPAAPDICGHADGAQGPAAEAVTSGGGRGYGRGSWRVHSGPQWTDR